MTSLTVNTATLKSENKVDLPVNKILQGDALTELKKLPSESISCVMTSPPYWALRDYGVKDQLGLEPTFQEYINRLCDIFDEAKRVLRKDGTCWINLGDTYCSKGETRHKGYGDPKQPKLGIKDYNEPSGLPQIVEEKSLCNIPARFSIEMQNRGWILRNVLIWHKPNCMPSSVKDRFTVDFEYLFFFVKNKKYWFETQYEPHNPKYAYDHNNENERKGVNWKFETQDRTTEGRSRKEFYGEFGRNKRAVWSICPRPFKEAHFATYPEELCETPIKAGCPEFICIKCGKARELIVESLGETDYSNNSNYKRHIPIEYGMAHLNRNSENLETTQKSIKGLSKCNCQAGFESGIVLDPFMGAGTTALVALKQGKRFLGTEQNPEYIKIAMDRIKPWLEQTRLFDVT
jgi:site-specific DNA-methyltransferase (adenine-specific)